MERDGAKRIAKSWGFLRLYGDDEEMRKLTSKEDREQARDLQAKLDRLPDISAWRRSRRLPEYGFEDEDRMVDEIVARCGEADFDPDSSDFPAWGFLKELGEVVHGLLTRFGLEERWFMPLWRYMVIGKLDPPKRYISVRTKTRALRFYPPFEDHEVDARTSKRARRERDRVKEQLDKDPEIKEFRRWLGWPEDGFPEWSDWERWLEENKAYFPLDPFYFRADTIEEAIDAMADRLMKRYGRKHDLRSREWLQSLRYYLAFGKLYPYPLQRRRRSTGEEKILARNRKIRQCPKEYSDELVAAIHSGQFTEERVKDETRKKIGEALHNIGLRKEQADRVIGEERGKVTFDREMVKDMLLKNACDQYLKNGVTEEEASRRARAFWTEDRMDRRLKRLDEATSNGEIVAHLYKVALDEDRFLPDEECLSAADVARIRAGQREEDGARAGPDL